jgi:hypothetical protein
MISRKVKISSGLSKLLSSDHVIHFKTSPEVFVENPANINMYLDLFYQAQLIEIANHE